VLRSSTLGRRAEGIARVSNEKKNLNRLAGEFLVASHLTYTVQVKALRQRNFFPIKRSAIEPHHVYMFVILNKPVMRWTTSSSLVQR
jgi:hypothetical protein